MLKMYQREFPFARASPCGTPQKLTKYRCSRERLNEDTGGDHLQSVKETRLREKALRTKPCLQPSSAAAGKGYSVEHSMMLLANGLCWTANRKSAPYVLRLPALSLLALPMDLIPSTDGLNLGRHIITRQTRIVKVDIDPSLVASLKFQGT